MDNVSTYQGAESPEFKFWIEHFLAGQPRASYLTSLGLGFLLCKWE